MPHITKTFQRHVAIRRYIDNGNTGIVRSRSEPRLYGKLKSLQSEIANDISMTLYSIYGDLI